MTKADEALLQFGRKYIPESYQTIIEALSKAPMTAAMLHPLLPDMTINGVKHAITMLRKCNVVYVKKYIPHPGKPQMLIALGDYTDDPQVRKPPRPRKPKKVVVPKIQPPELPTTTPRLGMFGV